MVLLAKIGELALLLVGEMPLLGPNPSSSLKSVFRATQVSVDPCGYMALSYCGHFNFMAENRSKSFHHAHTQDVPLECPSNQLNASRDMKELTEVLLRWC